MDPNQTASTNLNPTNPPEPVTPPVAPLPLKTEMMIPQPTAPRPKNFFPLVIGATAIALLLIMIIGLSVGITLIKSAFQYTPPPPPPVAAPEVTIKPVSSKYASDAGILKLRDDLKVIHQAIDSVDLIEPQIAPPALDLSISIK